MPQALGGIGPGRPSRQPHLRVLRLELLCRRQRLLQPPLQRVPSSGRALRVQLGVQQRRPQPGGLLLRACKLRGALAGLRARQLQLLCERRRLLLLGAGLQRRQRQRQQSAAAHPGARAQRRAARAPSQWELHWPPPAPAAPARSLRPQPAPAACARTCCSSARCAPASTSASLPLNAASCSRRWPLSPSSRARSACSASASAA
jgi:hypothetical protein